MIDTPKTNDVKRVPFIMTREAPDAGSELHREFQIDQRSIDEEARTVELSFSSEAEVERWFGIEILAHDPGNVRLERIRNGGALLMDHDRCDQIGVVESVRIDSDKRGRAVVRFSKSARANEIFQDVVDGIRRLVSVGYRVHATETENRPGGVEVVRVVDWEPFEISLVSIPADDSVGVGRSDSQTSPRTNTPNNNSEMNREQIIAQLRARGIAFEESATDDELRALLPTEPAANGQQAPANGQRSAEDQPAPPPAPAAQVTREAPPAPEVIRNAIDNAQTAERRRVADITAIADQCRSNGATVDASRAIADGVTADQFRSTALEAIIARQAATGPSGNGDGLSPREQRDLSGFSIVRGLGAIMQGRQLEGLEGEMHQEAIREAQRSGVNLEGNFHIPSVVLNHGRRDMTATGGTDGDQGGTMIATNLGSFIDLLYARLVLRDLGAQVLTGLVGNLDLPKLLTGTTPGNAAENAAASESSPTTGAVSLTPHRATTYVEVSQQLMIQSSPSVEAMLRNDLLTNIALLFEQRAISGSGASNQPQGILGTTGIGSIAGGTNGAAPTWANVVGLETEVAVDNADIGSLGYLTNPKVRGKLKTTSKAGTEAQFVWGDGGTPLNGYRTGVTTQVPSNLTKGTSSGTCSAIVFGNFSDLILAQWGGLSILANPYAKDTEGLVRLTVNTYHDNAVRRAQSFSAMQDALTA
jgi:HK97 family phage major capsid protein